MEVAYEILNQLGGNKFLAMTGAKHLIGTDNTLQMTLPKNMSKANRLKIILNGNDLYDVIFTKYTPFKYFPKTGKIRDETIITIKDFKNVYNNQLQELFTSVTGFNTHL